MTMDIRIQAIHFDISERLNDFINKKADRIARRFGDITDIDVTLRVVKPETANNKEALIKITVPHEDCVANKTADTFEEAVDLCLEALEHQLARAKEKK